MATDAVRLEIRAEVTPDSWSTVVEEGTPMDPEAVADYIERGMDADPTIAGCTVVVVKAPVESTLFTVGTDGCGNLIAYDNTGREVARIDASWTDEDDPMPYVQLARDAFFRLNAEIV
jgi:hypothetical protein